jgi:hypothetical protein
VSDYCDIWNFGIVSVWAVCVFCREFDRACALFFFVLFCFFFVCLLFPVLTRFE